MGLEASDLKRLSSLLDTALDLAPDARAAWLDALPADEKALAPLLRELLARHASGETLDFIDRPPAFDPPRDEASAGPVLAGGTTVGPYRLLREIGAGGMGEVWLGERADGTLKRQVALKLPRASWTPGLAERMARERDILATLEHAHIARLYDAGTDAQGRPWLALEYVEGQPIDAYCRERSLGLKARLALLLQVATAVAFAHTRLVVHRDLKPSNILVNAEGQVRLLDFGIAKLMEGERTAETQLTQIAGRALTLDYASPEQIRGEPIGTASDVYSLGVVAYELLAGTKPYRLKRGTAAELEEAIALADVPLASAAASDPAAKKLLKGDLDAILNKALKKAPADRYATVDALAQDIERYLAGHRVVARPDSPAYRLARFARRYRTPLIAAGITAAAFGLAIGVGATTLVILALLLGLGAALWQARKAREQAEIAREQTRIAQTEAKTAESVQNFLEGIFRANTGDQADPLRARQRTAIELLDLGARRIEHELDDAPAARLRVLAVLADMYGHMANNERQIELLRRRVALAAQVHSGATLERARTMSALATALVANGMDEGALHQLREAEAILVQRGDHHDETLTRVQMARLEILYRRGDPAGIATAEALIDRLGAGATSFDLLGALMMRGALQRVTGDPAAAVRSLERALSAAPAVPGGAAVGLAVLHVELARSQEATGDRVGAERNFRLALRHAEQNAGRTSSHAVILVGALARFLIGAGRLAEAAVLMADARERLAQQPPLLDRAHNAIGVLGVSATVERLLGRPGRAWSLYEELHAYGASEVDEPLTQVQSRTGRAETLLDLGRLDEAMQMLDDANALYRDKDLNSPIVAAELLQARIALDLARGDLSSAAGSLQRLKASHQGDRWTTSALEAELRMALGEWDAAIGDVQAALRGNARTSSLPGAALGRTRLLLVLARGLIHAERSAEALEPLAEALSVNAATTDAERSPQRLVALALLAEARAATGEREPALAALREAQAIRGRHGELGAQYLQPLDLALRLLSAS